VCTEIVVLDVGRSNTPAPQGLAWPATRKTLHSSWRRDIPLWQVDARTPSVWLLVMWLTGGCGLGKHGEPPTGTRWE
jgi:hypothetical protein